MIEDGNTHLLTGKTVAAIHEYGGDAETGDVSGKNRA
jgi:hypothetical protein